MVTRSIPRPYDPVKNMFLPDRYIRGTCPRCKPTDQYGDSCEVCGSTYAPSELLDPVSVISGEPPRGRESEQYFVKLGDFEAVLKAWIRGEHRAPTRGSRRDAAPKRAARDRQQAGRVVRRGAARLGHLARRAVLRVRDPGCPGQVLLCLARCAHRLHGELQAPVRAARGSGLRQPTGATDSKPSCITFIGKDIAYFHTLFLAGACFTGPVSERPRRSSATAS